MTKTRNPPGLKQALAAAKQLWPRDEIDWRYYPNSLPFAEFKARQKQQRAELERVRAELHSLAGAEYDLITSAQFVVDVQGDAPSIEHLAESLKSAKRQWELLDQRRQLEKDVVEYQHSRCEILHRRYGAIGWYSESGDTWEEVAKTIGGRCGLPTSLI